MSAEKKSRHTDKPPASSSAPDPAAALSVIREVRNLFRFHQAMGITGYEATPELWEFLRQRKARGAPALPAGRSRATNGTPSVKQPLVAVHSLQELKAEILGCSRCSLAENGQKNTAAGESTKPRLMVVGDWLEQGELAGQDILFGTAEDEMLRKMMAAIGLGRSDLYVTNAVKCVPRAGQTPDRSHEQACFALLAGEIAALRPGVICAMGECAARLLTGSTQPLVRLRGRFHPYRYGSGEAIRVMPTFHPRFLLRHPEMKRATWQDLQMIQRILADGGTCR